MNYTLKVAYGISYSNSFNWNVSDSQTTKDSTVRKIKRINHGARSASIRFHKGDSDRYFFAHLKLSDLAKNIDQRIECHEKALAVNSLNEFCEDQLFFNPVIDDESVIETYIGKNDDDYREPIGVMFYENGTPTFMRMRASPAIIEQIGMVNPRTFKYVGIKSNGWTAETIEDFIQHESIRFLEKKGDPTLYQSRNNTKPVYLLIDDVENVTEVVAE